MVRILNLLLIILFLLYPFGQLLAFPSAIFGLHLQGLGRIHPIDLFVFFLVLLWLSYQIIRRQPIKLPPGGKLILTFTGLAVLSWLINSQNYTQSETLVALLYLLRWSTYAGLYLVFFNQNFKLCTLNFKLRPTNLLLISGFLAAIFGLIQYFFIPDMTWLAAENWDPHYYRLVGTFLDPGFTGLIFVLALLLLVVLYWPKLWPPKLLPLLGFAFFYLALALTYSRSSYLAFFLSMSIIAYFKKSWHFAVIIFSLCLVTFFLLPQPGGEGVNLERTSTVWSRIRDYQNALQIIRDHPLFGVGFNFYRYAQRSYGFLNQDWSDNHAAAGVSSSLLFVFATTGFFGFLTYVCLLITLAYQALCHYLKFKEDKNLVAFASLFAIVCHAQLNNSLFYPWVLFWVWCLFGWSLASNRSS